MLNDFEYDSNKYEALSVSLVLCAVIQHMKKKLLDSDWLIAMQFKCNTRAKSRKKTQD